MSNTDDAMFSTEDQLRTELAMANGAMQEAQAEAKAARAEAEELRALVVQLRGELSLLEAEAVTAREGERIAMEQLGARMLADDKRHDS